MWRSLRLSWIKLPLRLSLDFSALMFFFMKVTVKMPVFKHWFSLTKGSHSVIPFRTECVCAMDEWVNEINSILHVYCTLKNQMSASCRGHQPANSICSSRENLTNKSIIAWSDFWHNKRHNAQDAYLCFIFYFCFFEDCNFQEWYHIWEKHICCVNMAASAIIQTAIQ